jgi:hypothetical protein
LAYGSFDKKNFKNKLIKFLSFYGLTLDKKIFKKAQTKMLLSLNKTRKKQRN